MQNCEPLIWYGAFVLLLTGGLIIVPYLRRKGDLLSAWNLLLLGIAMFLGLGCFEAAYSPIRFHGLQWFEPTVGEVNWFLMANTLFLAVLLLAYYYDPLPRKASSMFFGKWPPVTTGMVLFVVAACLALTGASFVTRGIVFLGPLLANASHKAMVFACVFSFALWYRNRLNPVWLLFFVGIFLLAVLMTALSGGGRRLVLSVLVGPVLYVYMASVRNWRPTKGVVAIGIAAAVIFVVTLMYSTIRHYDRGKKSTSGGRTVAGLVEKVKDIGNRNWFDRFASDQLFFFSQQVVHYAMLTQRFVETNRLEPQPFNTFKFLVVYPVPRRIWPEKPRPLGQVIVHDIVRRQTSWGTGIAGQSAYEGGLFVAAMFAYMAAFGTRLFDDSLRRQPTNPFLVAMLASASTHLLAWPRGDIGIMTIETVECFLFAIALGITGRLLFGTDRVSQPARIAVPGLPFGHRVPAR